MTPIARPNQRRSMVVIGRRTVDSAVNPLGIDTARPRFSWILHAAAHAQRQAAYRIVVIPTTQTSPATSAVGRALPAGAAPTTPCWDSGLVASGHSVGIRYGGEALESRTRYSWNVEIRDGDGLPSQRTDPCWFETALLHTNDWTANWIMHRNPAAGCAQLRRTFELPGPVVSARLYVTARGVYTASINSRPVSADRLTPGWTDYRTHLQYQTYDVTPMLRPGTNAIGVQLAPGWYTGRIATTGSHRYGRQPALRAQLEIRHRDGRQTVVCSDGRWHSATGSLRTADLLDGEDNDARRDTPGWTGSQYIATGWVPVRVGTADDVRMIAQHGPALRVTHTLAPRRSHQPDPSTRIIDFGQNLSGTVRLTIRDGTTGDVILLRYGEALEPSGRLHVANLRTAAATDRYTCADDNVQVYEPTFTTHGFRYLEVRTAAAHIRYDVTAHPIALDTHATGFFSTSDPILNRLHEAIVWTQRSNFTTVPTDCPQRDERLGWTGEAATFLPTALFNMDYRRAIGEKWLSDLRSAQASTGAVPDVAPPVGGKATGTPGWGDAIITVPYEIWQTYGDTAVIHENWPAMTRWLHYLRQLATDHILPDIGWGDWQTLGEPTRRDLINTACYAHSAHQVALMAAGAGYRTEARRYGQLAREIGSAFIQTFVGQDGHVAGDTQAGYTLALTFGLLPTRARRSAALRLTETLRRSDWHLTTGVLATPHLLTALSDNGYLDVAYRVLQQRTFPSWRYQLHHGATTLWEHWDSVKPDGSLRDPQMNSLNHCVHAAVGAWMYRTITGIRTHPRRPGYKHIIIQPRPGGDLTSAHGALDTVHGRIETRWHRHHNRITLSVSTPTNTTATVHVPGDDPNPVTDADQHRRAGTGIASVHRHAGTTVVEIRSGHYSFTSSEPNDEQTPGAR